MRQSEGQYSLSKLTPRLVRSVRIAVNNEPSREWKYVCVCVHINVLCRQKQLHETDSRTESGSTIQSPIIKGLPQRSAQTPARFPACFGAGDRSVFLKSTQRIKAFEEGGTRRDVFW
jgi:hypothetical protein